MLTLRFLMPEFRKSYAACKRIKYCCRACLCLSAAQLWQSRQRGSWIDSCSTVFLTRNLQQGRPCRRVGHGTSESVLTMFWIITRTTQRMTGKRIHDMFCLHWKRVFARAPQLAVLHFQSRWSSS